MTPEAALEGLIPRIEAGIRDEMKGVTKLSPAKVAREFIDTRRIKEQYDLLERYAGSLKGRRVLEIGSGFGLFTAYGNKFMNCRVEGIEPGEDEFHSTYAIALDILRAWNLDEGLISRGAGESIPFADDSFDVVYSSNVLEHVRDPKRVVEEALRVLKPGGTLQFVVPNYGSFWEGHYCIFWPPYLPAFLAPLYIRLLGKDVKLLKNLRFINVFMLKRFLRQPLRENKIEIVTWGEDVFRERMTSMNFSAWAGLSTVRRWAETAHKLGLIRAATSLMIFAKAQTPIILTLRKK